MITRRNSIKQGKSAQQGPIGCSYFTINSIVKVFRVSSYCLRIWFKFHQRLYTNKTIVQRPH